MTYLLLTGVRAEAKVYHMADYGVKPGKNKNLTQRLGEAIRKIKNTHPKGDSIILDFTSGHYHFYPDKRMRETYYISNHDQDNPQNTALVISQMEHVRIEGNGSKFLFHGNMLPIIIDRSSDCTISHLDIDFPNPHIFQMEVVGNKGSQGLTFKMAPWVKCRIGKNSQLEAYGHGWTATPTTGIVFEPQTRHIVYHTGDIFYSTKGVKKIGKNLYFAPHWNDKELKLRPGMIVAMRTWDRPAPGIFVTESQNVTLRDVHVRYARGMGLLAQMTQNITLDGFGVCLDTLQRQNANSKTEAQTSQRYFTTQADATHFSGCKGRIVSINGLYEGMMDDAINVHGTYLKVTKVIDDHTIQAAYMHEQTYGFKWGEVGDSLRFILTPTMDYLPRDYHISAITPDSENQKEGVKTFEIQLKEPLSDEIKTAKNCGVENLTWTPEVIFAHNTIRNNRARGALFSTPRQVIVRDNLFDHISGSAILLCGDCNGWYETGACRDVQITHNRFINCLTSMYQFTEAVISIYPEIPDLNHQQTYFHGGKADAISITDNYFENFGHPLLYAKSVDGLLFKDNQIKSNQDFKPFIPCDTQVRLERVTHASVQ